MQSHYNYVFDNITNTYNFTTRNDILYRVAFVVDETFSTIANEDIPNIYQFVVEKANEGTEPFDAKVSKTIEGIVERFFHNIQNALIYICSDNDEKALLRYKVFDRWYQKSEYKSVIVKMENIVTIKLFGSVQKLYTSFLFHKLNPNYSKLIEIYNRIEEVLNDK